MLPTAYKFGFVFHAYDLIENHWRPIDPTRHTGHHYWCEERVKDEIFVSHKFVEEFQRLSLTGADLKECENV